MNISYPLRQWLITISLGPLILPLIELSLNNFRNAIGLLEVYPLFLLFGIAFSLPTLLVYFIIYRFLTKRQNPEWIVKANLNLVAILGIAATYRFNLTKGNLTLKLFIAYCSVILLSSIILRLNTKQNALPLT